VSENQSPSFKNQIKNLTESGKNVIEDFIGGTEIFASEKLQDERWNICRQCEWFNVYAQQCKKCGCFLNIKIKFNSSFCPIFKWDKYNSPGKT
jgi:hypothetical protein